jgi:hypothetical protein
LSGALDGKNGFKAVVRLLGSTRPAFRSSPEIDGIARAAIAPGACHRGFSIPASISNDQNRENARGRDGR